ncbi:MAG TPA: adenylate/guanylate cyclase domain-containing protein, partial [Candidatus Dormibacteraeota bacterium]|nr:adenylate/guanylate cyclase domain-containing protein [Candidatus Dormibacteraeota bacterium]
MRSELRAAADLLTQAASTFAGNGYLLEQLRTLALLAEAQRGLGDEAAAMATFAAATALKPVSAPGAEPPLAAQPLTGERLVTVLFADIRGFTELTEHDAPAAMADRLAAFHRLAALAVERQHGIVDKFAGDAVMATFNASGWHVDHAEHAFDTALRILDGARSLGLAVGIGIAVGPAIVGTLSSGANISVLGTATNLASRLQSAAGGAQILLSDEAYRRVQHRLTVDTSHVEQRELALKGFAQPVSAYEVSFSG